MKPEMRHVAAEFEVRSEGEQSPVIRGHAAVFNSTTVIDNLFEERFAPGAFAEAVGADVLMVWNHNMDIVLGRTSSGTLRLSEDERGLAVENNPPKSAAREVESMQRGDVRGMSLRFRAKEQTWERRAGALPLRIITKAEVIEVSPTAVPYYKSTDIHVRSSADVMEELNSAAPIGPPAEDLTAIRQRFEFDRKREAALHPKGN
jgi:HK97 family phage prohead protease